MRPPKINGDMIWELNDSLNSIKSRNEWMDSKHLCLNQCKFHQTIFHIAVSTLAKIRTQLRSMTKVLKGGKRRNNFNSTVNLSEQVMLDYSRRGHCFEQSELMEPDTCQSKTSHGPDFIQDILLLLREITGPAVLSLWEAAARPNMSYAYSERCSNPRRPDSIFVLKITAIRFKSR